MKQYGGEMHAFYIFKHFRKCQFLPIRKARSYFGVLRISEIPLCSGEWLKLLVEGIL